MLIRRLQIACSLIVLSACNSTGEDTDVLSVNGSIPTPAAARITAVVEQPGRRTVFTHEQITAKNPDGTFVSARVRIQGRTGTMRVAVIVTTVPSDTIATGEVMLPIDKGNVYSVHIYRQPARMGNTCFGCSGYVTLPFGGSERATTDSLWLYYTARKPCGDCVY
jgi:hypothetical protein